jgi:hypothetical protein
MLSRQAAIDLFAPLPVPALPVAANDAADQLALHDLRSQLLASLVTMEAGTLADMRIAYEHRGRGNLGLDALGFARRAVGFALQRELPDLEDYRPDTLNTLQVADLLRIWGMVERAGEPQPGDVLLFALPYAQLTIALEGKLHAGVPWARPACRMGLGAWWRERLVSAWTFAPRIAGAFTAGEGA